MFNKQMAFLKLSEWNKKKKSYTPSNGEIIYNQNGMFAIYFVSMDRRSIAVIKYFDGVWTVAEL